MQQSRSLESVLEGIWRENDAVRERLLAVVQRLDEKQLNFRPAPRKWSIVEILDHLCLAERSLTRTVSRLLQQAAGRGLVRPAGLLDPPQGAIDLPAYQRPATAPESVLPSPERPLPLLLAELAESRERLRAVAGRVAGQVVGDVRLAHVELGELNFYQWLSVVGAHESKHLRQIEAITAHSDFPR